MRFIGEYSYVLSLTCRLAFAQVLKQANKDRVLQDIFMVMPSEMIDLLDLIRTSTVEVVEAIGRYVSPVGRSPTCHVPQCSPQSPFICRWKLAKVEPNCPYIWNGENYLTRIPTDLDFLADFEPLVNWLRMGIERNPFILRSPMLGQVAATAADPQGKEVLGAFEPAFIKFDRPKFKLPKPETSPYLTPVLNDLDICPLQKDIEKMKQAIRGKVEAAKPVKKESQVPEEIVPVSIIQGEELARIRKAEQAILREEALFYQAGSADAPVPRRRSVSKASFVSGAARLPSVDKRGSTPESGAETQGPGVTSLPEERGLEDKPRCVTPRLPMDAPDNAPALKRAKKMGSDLFLLTAAGTSGRMKSLARPNRFLRMDMDMDYLRQEIAERRAVMEKLQGQMESLERVLYPDRDRAMETEEEITSEDLAPLEDPTSVEQMKVRIRKEIEGLMASIGALEDDVRDRERELAFKEQCKMYLEQVKRIEGEGELATKLDAQRIRLRDGEILPDDEIVAISLEDKSATLIQKYVRGMVYRPYIDKYRKKITSAQIKIASIIRGFIYRCRAKRFIKRKLAATTIQAAFRASRVYPLMRSMQKARYQAYACKPIQAFFRGILGKRRAAHRRILVECSNGALDAVNHKGITPDDLLELGERILLCMVDPAEAYPPPAVLGLLRLLAMLLGSPEAPDVVSFYTLIGSRFRYILTSPELTWSNAMRMLRRTSKLLRKLRALASDPLRSPARIVYIPPECLALAEELRKDPAFTREAMLGIGRGAKCAVGLFHFYYCLEKVFSVQEEFSLDPNNCVPIWLRTFRANQQKRRTLHLQHEARKVGAEAADKAVKDRIRVELHWGFEMQVYKNEYILLGNMKTKMDRTDTEVRRLEATLAKEGEQKLKRLVEGRKHLERKVNIVRQERLLVEDEARKGSRKARLILTELNDELYRAEEALRGKIDDIRLCQELNELYQTQSFGEPTYPEDMVGMARELGDVTSRLQIAEMYREEFVASIGGRYYIPSLQGGQLEAYALLNGQVVELTARATVLSTDIQQRARVFEEEVYRVDVQTIIDDIRVKKWDRPTPDQVKREEDEDERCAQEEAARLREFLLPSVQAQLSEDYLGAEGRTIKSAPVLVVISRDCPMLIKRKVYAFIEEQFPGMFVDFGVQVIAEDGLNAGQYQRIFMGGKHIMAEFDVGSTFATRRAFVAGLFALKNGLDPPPRCLLVLGTLHDRRGVVSPPIS
jgi:hypothetical protein